MVSVSAHILQVVVFPPCAHTLLAVHHPPVLGQLAPGVRRAQENWLELGTRDTRCGQRPPSAGSCASGS